MRPELTSSVVISYIQNKLGNKSPIQKLYYIDSSFRRERPQKGRQRQFTQYGVEAIGSENPEQDVEIIMIAFRIYQMLGLKDMEVNINCIGSQSTRLKYVKSLKKFLTPFKNDLSEISKQRLDTNPLRILDSKSAKDKKIIESVPSIFDYLAKADKNNFDTIKNALLKLNINLLCRN